MRFPFLRLLATVLACVSTRGELRAAGFEFNRVPISQFPSPNQEVFSGAWGDFDNDGRPDLFLAGLAEAPGNLYRNTPAGFVRVNEGHLANEFVPRAAGAWGDTDNDGALDLYVAGAFSRPDSFYRNNGKGLLQPSSVDGIMQGQGISVVWSDFDRDGALDAYVVNGGGAAAETGFVLKNTGNGNLIRLQSGDLASYGQFSEGAAFGDYDGDGDDDLIVTSAWNQPNALFRNDGGGNFTRTTSGDVGTDTAGGAATPAWGDFDNDGDLDLLLINAGPTGLLFRNDEGRLNRLTTSNLTNLTGDPFGAAWADLDNDGVLDIVVARRAAAPLFFKGVGDGTFEDITPKSVATDVLSNGVAVADFDLDGDLDVWFSNWGQHSLYTSLFRNDSPKRNSLRVRLQGHRSNAAGIGAKVRIRTTVDGKEVWQLRMVGGFDSMGSQELIAHFGVGSANVAETVRVEWPSGQVQELSNVAVNQVLLVEETIPGPIEILPDGGSFEGSVRVTLISNIPGAQIRFTLDGSEPIATSTLYTSQLTLSSKTTVKARLFVNGFPVSEIRSTEFVPKAPLRFAPAGGLFTNAVEISLSSTIPNTEIRWTMDGSEPVLASQRYLEPIRLTAAASVKARAFLNGFPVTEVMSSDYKRVYVFGDDGIPSTWREQHFGREFATDPRAPATADPDGDGTSNRQEFTAGTAPLDPLSGFQVGIRAVPEVRWSSVVGKKYRILRLTTVSGNDSKLVAEVVATSTQSTWLDHEAGVVVNPAFYIVQPAP